MAKIIGEEAGISLPLYAAALIVTLCGVLTVADNVADAAFTQEVVTLTLVGFGFSLGGRALRINSRFVEWLCLGVIVLAIAGTLTQRVDWGALVPTAASKSDAQVAVILCWCAVLLSWALLHDSTLLFTPLLAVASIGLVASYDLNDYVAGYAATLLVAMIFLLTHSHARSLRAQATPMERARAAPGQLPFQLSLALLCGVVVTLLGLVLLTPVEAVTHNLSLAGAIRRLGNLGGVVPGNPLATRFSDETDFPIGTGEGWSASTQVLMRVTASDGQPHLWSGRTYDHYDGSSWRSTQTNLMSAPSDEATNSDGTVTFRLNTPDTSESPTLTASFDILGDTDEFYYAASPLRITLPMDIGIGPRYEQDGRLDLQDGRTLGQMHYTVASLAVMDPMDPAVQARLRHAGTDYPPEIGTLYLGNMTDGGGGDDGDGGDGDEGGRPVGLNPHALAYFRQAVAEALKGLPASRRTPIDEALAIRTWVAGHCVYSLSVNALDDRQDHVYQFLAHTREGYCDMFASSMAVLCRVAGLPSRVATGFAPGEQDGDEYDLRSLDKHAWTEVYFPGAGWLPFDATTGTRSDGSVPSPVTHLAWSWREVLGHLGFLPIALGIIILALLVYVAEKELSARWRLKSPARADPARASRLTVGRRYEHLTRILAGLGLPRGQAETPDEYGARARAFLTAQGPDAPPPATVGLLTAQLTAARYGATEAAVPDADMERMLREFAASSARLRLRLLIRSLTRHWERSEA